MINYKNTPPAPVLGLGIQFELNLNFEDKFFIAVKLSGFYTST